MRYDIKYSYYDGKNIANKTIGIIDGRDIKAFISHLKAQGFIGRGKDNKGRYTAYEMTIDPGILDHHGDHTRCVYIEKHVEKGTLPLKHFKRKTQFDMSDYEQIAPGKYAYCGGKEDDE